MVIYKLPPPLPPVCSELKQKKVNEPAIIPHFWYACKKYVKQCVIEQQNGLKLARIYRTAGLVGLSVYFHFGAEHAGRSSSKNKRMKMCLHFDGDII